MRFVHQDVGPSLMRTPGKMWTNWILPKNLKMFTTSKWLWPCWRAASTGHHPEKWRSKFCTFSCNPSTIEKMICPAKQVNFHTSQTLSKRSWGATQGTGKKIFFSYQDLTVRWSTNLVHQNSLTVRWSDNLVHQNGKGMSAGTRKKKEKNKDGSGKKLPG